MNTPEVFPDGEGWGSVDDEAPAQTSVIEQAIPAERWRRWTPPAALEDSPTDVVVEDGFASRATDVTWTRDSIERIKHGYQCLKCWEPQPTPFPKECPVCGYPMEQNQAQDFVKEFQGDKWIGPTVSLEEHLGILEEKSERKTHVPGSSIIVPGWAKT